jgi:hypothetical protein
MTVVGRPGSGELARVKDAGMVGVVADDQVGWARQGTKNAEVGLVPRGKEKHGFKVEEGGEGGFKFSVLGEIAGD